MKNLLSKHIHYIIGGDAKLTNSLDDFLSWYEIWNYKKPFIYFFFYYEITAEQ